MDGLKMMTILGSFQGNGGGGNSGDNTNGGRKISWLQPDECVKNGNVYLLDTSDNEGKDFSGLRVEPFGRADLHVFFPAGSSPSHITFPVSDLNDWENGWSYSDTLSSYANGPLEFLTSGSNDTERWLQSYPAIITYQLFNNGERTSMFRVNARGGSTGFDPQCWNQYIND